jgi:hypothetical protein
MKISKSLMFVIVGTCIVSALRAFFPEADTMMLDFIDQNLVAIGICLCLFFAYCFYLLRKHNAKSR